MKDSIYIQYLISNNQDSNWGLTINTVGYQNIPPDSVYPTPYHPYNYLFSAKTGRVLNEYQLLYISQGKGVFESDSFDRTQVVAGDMLLLFPGEWHSYCPEKNIGWDEYWIGFNGVHITNYVANGFFKKQKPIFKVGFHEDIVLLYRQAIQVSKKQKIGYQQMLSGIVNHLLGYVYLQDSQSPFEDTKINDCINRAKMIMVEKFATGISPEEVARQINVSYSWFRRVFKQYTCFAPAQYIRELKIQKSKDLLINTSMNSQEIAFEVGFESPEYFCYAFKKRFGKTPTKFRENILK
jgi:AraC-like DNA-binding protein